MKRLFEFPALLVLGLLSFFGMQEVHAEEPTTECWQYGPGQIGSISPNYNPGFGSWVNMVAKIGANCQTYRTPNPTWTHSGKTSQVVSSDRIESTSGFYNIPTVAQSTASASNSSFSVTSGLYSKYTNGASSVAEVQDLVRLEFPNYDPNDPLEIPVKLCSDFQTPAELATHSTTSYVAMGFHAYEGEQPNPDDLDIPSGQTINHAVEGEGQICRTGNIVLDGQYAYFWVKVKSQTLGKADTEPFELAPGNVINVATREGTLTSSFGFDLAPGQTLEDLGVSCESRSGVFPGCDRNFCSGDDDLVAEAEGPEQDYSDSIFSLERNFRNTSVCEPSGCGVNWHGSYDRTANFLLTSESHTVAVTSAGSFPTIFRENSAGIWDLVEDTGAANTFVEILDNFQTLIGYLHTNEAGVQDTYDLNGVLTKSELPSGEILDVTYDASDRLSAVTDSVSGDNLTFSYNANDQVSMVTAPTDTISYTYDANDNLATTVNAGGTRTYHYTDPISVNALTGMTDESGVFNETIAVSNSGSTQKMDRKLFNRILDFMFEHNPDLVGNRLLNYGQLDSIGNPIVEPDLYFDFVPNLKNAKGQKTDGHVDFDYDAVENEVFFDTMMVDNNYLNLPLVCNDDKWELYDFYETLVHEHWHYKKGPDPESHPDMEGQNITTYDYYRPPSATVIEDATGIPEYGPVSADQKGKQARAAHKELLKKAICTCKAEYYCTVDP